MTGPRPTCTRTEQAVGWALHALEPDEEIAVERHVPTCPDCSAAVRDAQVVMAQLATAVEQVDPPARLRASILDAAAATPQVRPQVAAQPPPSPGPRQPRTARPTGPAGPRGPAGPAPGGRGGPAPGGPRPTGPQPAGRSRRLSPGRLVTAAVAAVAIVAAGGSRDPHRPAAATDGPVAAAARHRVVAGVQYDRARAGPRPPRQLARPAGQAGRHGGRGGRPRGQPAHRLHDRPRRQLRRPDLRAVGPQGRHGRPRAARGVRRGSERGHPANRRLARGAAVRRVRDLPGARPHTARSADRRRGFGGAHRVRPSPGRRAVLYCRPRWGD